MRNRNRIATKIGGYGMSAYCAAGSAITLTRGMGFTSIMYGAASLVIAAATNEVGSDAPIDLDAADAQVASNTPQSDAPATA